MEDQECMPQQHLVQQNETVHRQLVTNLLTLKMMIKMRKHHQQVQIPT